MRQPTEAELEAAKRLRAGDYKGGIESQQYYDDRQAVVKYAIEAITGCCKEKQDAE